MTDIKQMLYECFGEVYYEHEYPEYPDSECGTTEAIQCLRKSFLQRKVGRKLFQPKTVILSFGRLVHKALKEPLEKRGYRTEHETRYGIDKYTLWTHSDAVHTDHGLELKTITGMPHQPLMHHWLQSNTYMHVNNIPQWYLGYIHKPSGIIKTFPLRPQQKPFQFVCLRVVRLCKSLQTNAIPDPEPSWLCQYCEYIDICPNPRRYVSRVGGF